MLNARFCAALAGMRVLPAMLRAFALRTVLLAAGPDRPQIVFVVASQAIEFIIAVLFSGSGDGSSSAMQDRHAQDSSSPSRSSPRHPVIPSHTREGRVAHRPPALGIKKSKTRVWRGKPRGSAACVCKQKETRGTFTHLLSPIFASRGRVPPAWHCAGSIGSGSRNLVRGGRSDAPATCRDRLSGDCARGSAATGITSLSQSSFRPLIEPLRSSSTSSSSRSSLSGDLPEHTQARVSV